MPQGSFHSWLPTPCVLSLSRNVVVAGPRWKRAYAVLLLVINVCDLTLLFSCLLPADVASPLPSGASAYNLMSSQSPQRTRKVQMLAGVQGALRLLLSRVPGCYSLSLL